MGSWDKLSTYLKDATYEELIILSNKGTEFGIKKYNTGETLNEKEAENCKQKMNKLLEQVREFNIIKAQLSYGDGILDYDYACGKSDIYSLRLGHCVPQIDDKDEEER
ncbi:MAG: hypothetical protein IKF83_03430 [Clostridia bacterium]|nr:hypothetical protein [Clostridia bacterium]